MSRLLFIVAMGIILGALVHLVTVMAVPRVSEHDGWSRAMALAEEEGVALIPPARPGNESLPLLDPSVVYAVCRFDLSGGPWRIRAPLPRAFWSMALHTIDSGVFYAVTQDATPGRIFDVEIRNAEQMRRFRIEEIDVDPDTLQIEAPGDAGLVLFRALAPGRSGHVEAEAALEAIECGRLPERANDPERTAPLPLPRERPQQLR